jgi:hypothetical protein
MFDTPQWPDQAEVFVTKGLSSSLTTDEILSRYVFLDGSATARRSIEETRLDELLVLAANWDGRGSAAPSPQAIRSARDWLRFLSRAAESSGTPWSPPHISASEDGAVTFEWWQGERKVTLYFSDRAPEYLKVWGPHIFEQMESGNLRSSESYRDLWSWLHAA